MSTMHERGHRNPFMSHFEKNTWDQFIEAHRPLAYVQSYNEPVGKGHTCIVADVKRCRQSAFTESEWDFPVFSSLDTIKPATPGELCDFNYIERDINCFMRSEIQDMGYVGQGWYHRCIVEYFLSRKIISWSHILFGLQASSHIERGSLRVPISQIKAAWSLTHGCYSDKESINACIGLFGRRKSYVYNTLFTLSLIHISEPTRPY